MTICLGLYLRVLFETKREKKINLNPIGNISFLLEQLERAHTRAHTHAHVRLIYFNLLGVNTADS